MQNKQGKVDYKVLYAQAVYGVEEKKAVLESLENPWLAAGPKVAEFEQKIADLFGHQYGIATNSGSSANLLAFEMLDLPPGSEVITPACTFSTVVSSLLQNNLVPVFVDSVIGRYVMDEDLVEQAITPKTKAIMAPHLIGGVADLKKLREICDTYHLALVDDSCDTLGVKINNRPSGYYSDISTTSFYGSHIITAMGFGGMVCLSDRVKHTRGILLKDWGRLNADGEGFEERFGYQIDGIPYDSKFLYGEFGYNLKMNEAAAAFGLEQLKRLPGFIKQRNENFLTMLNYFRLHNDWFHLPKVLDGHATLGTKARTNWLAFPLTIKKGAPFARFQLLKYLEDHGIQTRVLFAGNITRHPAYRTSPDKFRIASELKNADLIMENGLLLGCHQGMDGKQVEYVLEVVGEFLKNVAK